MALISCPECKGRVSDLALACPHCGFPIKESQPRVKQTKKTRAKDSPAKERRVDIDLATHGFCVACGERHTRRWKRGVAKHFFQCRRTGRVVIMRDGEDEMKAEF